MKKLIEKIHREQEEELDRQAYLLLQQKDKMDADLYRKRCEEQAKLTEYHKKQ